MKESKIEKDIREYAESRFCLFKKFSGIAGWPDRIIISVNGHVAFMEVKKPGGDIAPKQLRVGAMLNARNVPSCIVDNVESGKGFIDSWLSTQRCPTLAGEIKLNLGDMDTRNCMVDDDR